MSFFTVSDNPAALEQIEKWLAIFYGWAGKSESRYGRRIAKRVIGCAFQIALTAIQEISLAEECVKIIEHKYTDR